MGHLSLICRLEKSNNAKGQLGSARPSDDSFAEMQYSMVWPVGFLRFGEGTLATYSLGTPEE